MNLDMFPAATKEERTPFAFRFVDGRWVARDGCGAQGWQVNLINYMGTDAKGFSKMTMVDDMLSVVPYNCKSRVASGNGSDEFTRGIIFQNFKIECATDGRRVIARQLVGFQQEELIKDSPSQKIRKEICERPSVLSGISKDIQPDHKNGRKNVRSIRVDDYQALTRDENYAKRAACKECKKTDARFDARSLGYPIAVAAGDIHYEGTCEGCFWFDVAAFRANLGVK